MMRVIPARSRLAMAVFAITVLAQSQVGCSCGRTKPHGDADTDMDVQHDLDGADFETCIPCGSDEECPNFGNPFCTGRWSCIAGCCVVESPPGCDDGVDCTTDLCFEDEEICVNRPDHEYCVDRGLGDYCDPLAGCITFPTPCIADECDDDFFCNGVETCVDDSCVPGEFPCSDGVACTADECSDLTSSCVFVPEDDRCPEGEVCDALAGCIPAVPCPPPCDDGVACNGAEYCGEDGFCHYGPPVSCPGDGVDCTDDYCVEATGGSDCVHVPLHMLCPEGYCDPVAGCIPPPPCSSGCDDGQYCNGLETCIGDVCTSGTPLHCDDGVACTVDTCNEITDGCDHAPMDSLCGVDERCDVVRGCVPDPWCCGSPAECDDGVYCNGAEDCVACDCRLGTAVDCSDGLACTVDECNEPSRSCQNVPDHDLCPEGEVCDPPGGCVTGTPCTAPGTPEPVCQDGSYCNGAEICGTDLICGGGTGIDCNDHVPCTVDSCDEVGDTCSRVPDPMLCTDHLFCTGAETCSPTTGCLAGTPVVCDDHDPCTADECDESGDSCMSYDIDVDRDGHGVCSDCNDHNDTVWTGECTTGTSGTCTTTCGSTGSHTCGSLCTWSPCDPPSETCNGFDDDCDTLRDEGFPCVRGERLSCTTTCGSTGSGFCRSDCTLPLVTDCVPPGETCNALDDDCDGSPDDGFACVRGASVSCTTTCGSTGSGTCALDCSMPPPTACTIPPETCNGIDDDCDGRRDETFACVRGTSVSCTTSCGSTGSGTCTSSCTVPTGTACAAPAETCNGLDDDCDAVPDDGFTCVYGDYVSCTTSCGSSGTGFCTSACTIPTGVACSAPAETCNGIDDDCDTVPDDGFGCVLGRVEPCLVGTCTGDRECLSGCTWSTCDFGPPPSGDTCGSATRLLGAGGIVEADICTAADDYFGSCGGVGAGDVVYYFDVTGTAMDVSLNTVGSSFDTALYVRSGSCTGSQIACNDNTYGAASEVRLAGLAPGRYYVFVDGHGLGDNGTFALEYNLTASSVTGDRCGNTRSITGSGSYLGDTCALANDYNNVLSTSCALPTTSAGEEIFSFYIDTTRTVTFSTCNGTTDYDTLIYLVDVCNDPTSQIDCNDDLGTSCGIRPQASRITTTLAPGLYYLMVDGFVPAKCGDYLLEVTGL